MARRKRLKKKTEVPVHLKKKRLKYRSGVFYVLRYGTDVHYSLRGHTDTVGTWPSREAAEAARTKRDSADLLEVQMRTVEPLAPVFSHRIGGS